MQPISRVSCRLLAGFLLIMAPATLAAEEDWIVLIGEGQELDAWKGPTADWHVVSDVELNTEDPRHLRSKDGSGVIVNDPPGRVGNLVTEQEFVDLEAHIEYAVPERSNSGVKFMGLYEIQIYDSYGVPDDKITANGNGGVYPRARLLPRYQYLDEGYPPRTNASKPPGDWQTLHVLFRAPRFDESGEKVANARFEKVVLNGKVIHEDLEVPYPTGHAWNTRKEIARGPILLQGDHGPVAFRNLKVRPIEEEKP
ncbi:hypothetical protein BH23PLA1_BH23PLA1_16530 [soil metagenome]